MSFRKPVKTHILGFWNAEQNEACQIGVCRDVQRNKIFRVGRGLAPAVSAPSDEGAVKCAAFDWGRDFFISLPPSRLTACHLPLRGRGYGAPSRRPLRSNCFLCVGNGLDHSVKHIKLRGQTQFAPTSREQPLCCSVKLHQNLRAGVETRPYKRVVETPTPTHEMECGCPTTPNLSSCAIAKDLTYKRNHICKSFFAERRRMTKAAGFSNFAAFIVCLHTKRKNPDAYASGISGSRYKTNHLPHLLTTSNAVDGERGIIPFRCVYIITADYCNPNTNL